MPYRDRSTVESWIHDFVATRGSGGFEVSVLDKNFEAGPDSGLVVVHLRTASTITFLHPDQLSTGPRWVVTFDSRSDAIDLDPDQLLRLSEDIAALSDLCTFLQRKTDAAILAR